MLKKELLEAINVLILHSDFCDINMDDDRFDVKFSYYGKKDIIDSVDRIDFSQPTHKEEEKPIIAKTSNEYWPRGKKPSLDLEGFKIALTQYIIEHPEEKQREIGKAFGLNTSSINTYIKRFCISYGSKVKKTKETPQKIIIEHDLQGFVQNGKETNNGDMLNHAKKELYSMIKNAILNINMVQIDTIALKSKFDSFGNDGNSNLITSNLGTWILKPLNGSSDSHLEFTGLAISAKYQLFPRWEIGKSYCILRFYGNIKTVEYVVSAHNGQMRVNQRS